MSAATTPTCAPSIPKTASGAGDVEADDPAEAGPWSARGAATVLW
jgi:hypothetical protein